MQFFIINYRKTYLLARCAPNLRRAFFAIILRCNVYNYVLYLITFKKILKVISLKSKLFLAKETDTDLFYKHFIFILVKGYK